MQTKKIISVLAASFLCFSTLLAQGHHHDGGGHHGGHHSGGHSHETIVGKTFLIHYTNQDYKMTFVTDSTIKWMDAKATDGIVYALNKIGRGIYLSSWDDKTEGALSQVIDMHNQTIYTAKLGAGKKIVNTTATITPQVVETSTPATPAQPAKNTAPTPDKK